MVCDNLVKALSWNQEQRISTALVSTSRSRLEGSTRHCADDLHDASYAGGLGDEARIERLHARKCAGGDQDMNVRVGSPDQPRQVEAVQRPRHGDVSKHHTGVGPGGQQGDGIVSRGRLQYGEALTLKPVHSDELVSYVKTLDGPQRVTPGRWAWPYECQLTP